MGLADTNIDGKERRGNSSEWTGPVPLRNGYRAAYELSRGNELPNGFVDRSRWLELFQKKIAQGG